MNTARVLILSVAIGATLGVVPSVARPVPAFRLTPQLREQIAAAARQRAEYIAEGQPYGAVIHAGVGGVDSGVMVEGKFVQLEYLDCIGKPGRLFEDGSIDCGQ